MEQQNTSDDLVFYFVLAGIAYILWYKYTPTINFSEIVRAILVFVGFVALGILAVIIIIALYRRADAKKQEKEQKRAFDEHVAKKRVEEAQRERLAQIQAIKDRKEAKRAEHLFRYFERRDSDATLPDWALETNPETVQNAREKFQAERKARKQANERKKEEKAQEEVEWQEAVSFVLNHRGYPAEYPKYSLDQKTRYKRAVALLRAGKLELEVRPIPEEEDPDEQDIPEKLRHLLNRPFYHREELTREQIKALLGAGYRHKPFIFRDGKSGNNLIIRNNGNESDYHFCMKHLFAEIDSEHAELEYAIGNVRADVAFVYPRGKIAVEIETGLNNGEQVEKKVKWLNNKFQYWIFVCARQNLGKYQKFVDNRKSFCLTLKKAEEKVQQLTSKLNII